MALPSSGAISVNMINTEIKDANPTDQFSFNSTKSRLLANISSGTISFSSFHGKICEIVTPINNVPSNASTHIVLSPELDSSNFSVVGGSDTYDGREYIIKKVSDNSVVYNPTI
jgi:hypothetical protein